jgi:hypothetical protein
MKFILPSLLLSAILFISSGVTAHAIPSSTALDIRGLSDAEVQDLYQRSIIKTGFKIAKTVAKAFLRRDGELLDARDIYTADVEQRNIIKTGIKLAKGVAKAFLGRREEEGALDARDLDLNLELNARDISALRNLFDARDLSDAEVEEVYRRSIIKAGIKLAKGVAKAFLSRREDETLDARDLSDGEADELYRRFILKAGLKLAKGVAKSFLKRRDGEVLGAREIDALDVQGL